MALVTIHSVSDLNRVLSAQRAMTLRATRDLDRIIGEIHSPATGQDHTYLGEELLKRERALIAEYAVTPTLTEFSRNASIAGIAHWGTTFCVAALFGELVLAHIRTIEPRFQRVHRILSMLLLKELDQPDLGGGDLVDTALRFMQIELRQDAVLSDEERKSLLRAMVKPLVLAMLSVFTHYGLVECPGEEGYTITGTGQGVLRHLYDAQAFIDEIAAAHKALQQAPIAQSS
jgi:hypothetical protein